ncbi:hypothetical protein [Streptomyces parvus]|uniref:hypothetical protein n=1 Tax=Streptomyces parvus TaxID=66428 RepID=UPI00332CA8C2
MSTGPGGPSRARRARPVLHAARMPPGGAVLGAGLCYEGLEPCGCGKRPRFRPRTGAEVRARLAVAARTGVPVAEALARRDPAVPEEDD